MATSCARASSRPWQCDRAHNAVAERPVAVGRDGAVPERSWERSQRDFVIPGRYAEERGHGKVPPVPKAGVVLWPQPAIPPRTTLLPWGRDSPPFKQTARPKLLQFIGQRFKS